MLSPWINPALIDLLINTKKSKECAFQMHLNASWNHGYWGMQLFSKTRILLVSVILTDSELIKQQEHDLLRVSIDYSKCQVKTDGHQPFLKKINNFFLFLLISYLCSPLALKSMWRFVQPSVEHCIDSWV